MIAEIIPEAYDAVGRKVSQPFLRRRGPHPNFPMGRYVSQPLSVKCDNILEVRRFLFGCRYVSDEKLFGERDYWQPPEEFEILKKGDCDDFALWTWRQLMTMGYKARYVLGKHGRYRAGHAWVVFFKDEKCFLVEPQRSLLGDRMPRISTLRYHPTLSVAWEGDRLSYFAHKSPAFRLKWLDLVFLLPEWITIWGWFWIRIIPRLPFAILKKIWRRFAFPKQL